MVAADEFDLYNTESEDWEDEEMDEESEDDRPLGISKDSPYRKALISLISSIDRVVPLREQDQVLMVIVLDTEKKIKKFNAWIKSKLTGENDLQTTAREIVRAATLIGNGMM